MTGAPPNVLLTDPASKTSFPVRLRRVDAIRTSPTWARCAARSAAASSDPCTRPSLRVRRALTPWRSQASSCASFLSSRSSSRASFVQRGGLLLEVRRVATRATTSGGRDRARRSGWRGRSEKRAIVGDEQQRAAETRAGESSSQRIASMSRWFVGSSSSSRSGSDTSALPSSARRRQPPDSSRIGRSAGSARREITSLDLLLEPPAVALFQLVLQRRPAAPAPRRRRRSPRRAPRRGDSRRRRRQARRVRSRPRRRRTGRRTRARPARAGRCAARLRQIAAGVGWDLAGDHFQQAGLAGPVPADERDALSRLDAKIRRFEERQVTERERNRIEGNERHWIRSDLTRSRPLRPTGAVVHVPRAQSRRASTAQTACASRRRSCRAMSPHQNSPVHDFARRGHVANLERTPCAPRGSARGSSRRRPRGVDERDVDRAGRSLAHLPHRVGRR